MVIDYSEMSVASTARFLATKNELLGKLVYYVSTNSQGAGVLDEYRVDGGELVYCVKTRSGLVELCAECT